MQFYAYNTSGHAVYAMLAHVVFVPKNRHKCLTREMLGVLRDQSSHSGRKWRCDLVECDGEEDHVHLQLSLHPTVAISELEANFKTVTARRMRSEFARHLRQYSWKPVF